MLTRLWEVDFNTWILLVVGILSAFTTYYARRTEKNTNSMKDALVAATAKASEAAGAARGRKEQKDEAAAFLLEKKDRD